MNIIPSLLIILGLTFLPPAPLNAMEHPAPAHSAGQHAIAAGRADLPLYRKRVQKKEYAPSSRADSRFDFRPETPQNYVRAESAPHHDEFPHSFTLDPAPLEALSAPFREALEQEALLLGEKVNKTIEIYARKQAALLVKQGTMPELCAAIIKNTQKRDLELLRMQEESHKKSMELLNMLHELEAEKALSLLACHV